MSDLDFSMLDKKLGEIAENGSDLIPIVELKPGQIDSRYLRSSYSSSQLLHACPRKFQLKCLQAKRADDASTSVTFAYGHAVGDGVAELMITRNLSAAIWKLFLSWDVEFLAENEKQKKSIAHAVLAIQMFHSSMQDGYLSEYEVAAYNNKPAAELSFRITIPGKYGAHTYRGYIDLVLRNIISGELGVLENKTSSGSWVNHYQYKNSAQALGYGVVLDEIDANNSSYEVMYNVYMTKLFRWEEFNFHKSFSQKAMWLRDIIYDVNQVETYVANEGNYGIWPLRGESCTNFGRVCEYMDICQLDTKNLMSPLRVTDLEETKEYDVELDIGDLI